MKSGEKTDGRNSDRAFFNSKRDWPCDLMGGEKGESQESCWRRSRYWVLYPMEQAEWQQGLVRQTLVEHLRHVVPASCGSHHQDTGADWPQPGWQNVGFSACLE